MRPGRARPRALLLTVAFSAAVVAQAVAVPAALAADPPDTVITSGPFGTVVPGPVSFEFTANERDTTFQCSLDDEAFAGCTSPQAYGGLARGDHTFLVRAMSSAGGPDPTPDGRSFTVGRSPCQRVALVGRPIALGCSAIQLMRRTGAFLNPVMDGLRKPLAKLRGRPGFAGAVNDLTDGLALLKSAGEHLGEGQPCPADRDAGLAAAKLRTARIRIGDALDRMQQDLAGQGSFPGGDASQSDLLIAGLRLQQAIADDAVSDGLGVADAFDAACGAVTGPLEARGRVVRIDDADGTFELEDGSVFGLPFSRHGSALVKGRVVDVNGLGLADGTGVATSVKGTSASKVAKVQCLALRMAPVQRFSASPLTLLAPSGYVSGGVLQLETGMRLGVTETGCPGATPEGRALHYTMKIDVEQGGQTVTVATDLGKDEAPVPFPWSLAQGGSATVNTTVIRTNCKVLGPGLESCQPPEILSQDSFDILLRQVGSYSDTEYDTTVFGVTDDGVNGNFEKASVTGFDLHFVSSATNPVFHAEGYKVNGGSSTKPQVVPIDAGDQFAVYDTDFYDPGYLWLEDEVLATGQDRPGGIRWPRIVGKRNGHPYRYFSSLPSLVKDRVAVCPTYPSLTIPQGPPIPPEDPTWNYFYPNYPPREAYTTKTVKDSFYKLPFEKDFQPGTGLMNIDDAKPSGRHPEWQPYAFDLGAPESTPLLAARRGVVVINVHDDPYNVSDAAKPANWPGIGNYMWIAHDDGTYAVYFHMKYNSNLVWTGSEVSRGDQISLIGQTGNATGPHTHFEVTQVTPPVPDSQHTRVRFQALTGANKVKKGCYIPRKGDTFFSTNG
jgi:hypothetical protein